MGTPHKHAELIKAWADDPSLRIECRVPKKGRLDTQWTTIPETEAPSWNVSLEYRIKPKTIKFRIGVFIGTNGDFSSFIVTNEPTHNYYEKLQHFVKWVGDWQEIEV